MEINYEGTDYTFDLEEIDVMQARRIKKTFGLTLFGLEEGLGVGDPDALAAVYWLMLIQSGQKANMETVNFKLVKFAAAVNDAQKAAEEAEEAEKAEVATGPKKPSTPRRTSAPSDS